MRQSSVLGCARPAGLAALLTLLLAAGGDGAAAATMNDYCIQPPFVSQSVPPLVMFEVGREHKLYYEAYNDANDLDDDGRLDTTYKHSIDYYGYFDPYKCYTHSGGSGSNDKYTPVSTTADKFCSSGQWSGNILNWLTMSRMDVLKKVLFGGQRSADSNTATYLERVYVPQDAHSWGKEVTGRLCSNGTNYTDMCQFDSDCDTGYTCVDKSVNLIGITASDTGTACSFTSSIKWDTTGKILVAKYTHSNFSCGSDSTDLISSYEPANLVAGFPVYVATFGDAILNPAADHGDQFNYLALAEFSVSKSDKGNWMFAIDGDDGVELEIINPAGDASTIVASRYGCNSACNCQTNSGTINLNTTGYWRLIARHSEKSGQDGVKVWYKKPSKTQSSDPWVLFGSSTLTLRAPTIPAGAECTLKDRSFIETGKPKVGTTPKQHLFCSTTLSDGGTPILRFLGNKENRIWEWVSKERPVCDSSLGAPTDYTVQVEVCKSVSPDNRPTGKKDDLASGRETNCKDYAGTFKPVGLLQKFGEGEGAKVCSRTLAKSCTSDSDCGAGEGLCIYKSPMYFGMFTDSYTKNLSGGVLRKNIGSILDETNANNGIFQTSENVQGNIMITLDRLKTIGFRYTDQSYQDSSGGSCGWITDRPLNEGECRMWGNPIAEMMYESLRYFAGKGTPTTEFTYTTPADSGLSLSKPSWGYSKGSTTYQLYDIYPPCAKPFMLILSDINPSYDSDQIPGSSFKKTDGTYFSEDAASPQLGLGVAGADGVSLLNKLADTIGTSEGIIGDSWFVGENGSTTDFVCSSKSVTKLSLLRGMCPEEPTKRGSFYSAALAYYGLTLMKEKTGKPDVSTFVVALSSPVADLKIKAGNSHVSILPVGKSVSGSHGINASCAQKCTLTADEDGLHISNCSSTAYCPSNQIVDFYIDSLKYDNDKNVIYAKYRINYEDVEQGADHDMDAIVTYEVCTQSAIDQGLGACSGSLGSNIQIKLNSDYAAGSIDQVMGFVISGTTEDGVYLPVRDRDVSSADSDTPATVAGLPLNWSKTFTISGNPTGTLKSPLWYAAKWGGFIDANNNKKPDLASEWDKDGDGEPDNYFLVVNPLKLEQQLQKALTDILNRVSSGTAASILSNNDNNGATLLQAIFYPRKNFAETELAWTGELQAFWYYIDPFLNTNSIREDTDQDLRLKLKTDYVLDFRFDTNDNKTKIDRSLDVDGNGSGDSYVNTIEPEQVNALWKAGSLLWSRNLSTSPRTIYTSYRDAASKDQLTVFTTAGKDLFKANLQATDATEEDKIINYIRGTEQSGYRNRTVTIGGSTGVWRLGDIISSTPRLQSNARLNGYHLPPPVGYKDSSYQRYLDSNEYKTRGMGYVGANDGMLHAFNLGVLKAGTTKDVTSFITGSDFGKEMWTYIPRNALPYLKYLADPEYDHLYYVDASPSLNDVSIEVTEGTGCTDAAYWLCTKQTVYQAGTDSTTKELDLDKTSWRTVLLGAMGLGGASRNTTDACSASTDCVKTPIANVGYSSYFALDVTTPTSPSLMWEFASADLGYSTVGPAIVRIGGETNGRWFAVLASGPTGPINTQTHQFLGRSTQTLKLFILDLKTGALLRTIDTGIQNAFAGSLSGGTLDTDRSAGTTGKYNDDAVYLGYVRKDTTTGTWTKGGVLRLFTKENIDPAQWWWATLVDDIGPVTSAVAQLQDTTHKNHWLFFGSGRYYYKAGSDLDDAAGRRALYGIKDPCYDLNNKMKTTCNTPTVLATDLVNQTDSIQGMGTAPGWYVLLDEASGSAGAERVITDPVAAPNGAIFFTSFKPAADVCKFGGDLALWGVNYSTGGYLAPSQLIGEAIIQSSTGSFEQIDLGSSFTQRLNRKTAERQGVPPRNKPTIVTNANIKPQKRIIHIREK